MYKEKTVLATASRPAIKKHHYDGLKKLIFNVHTGSDFYLFGIIVELKVSV